MQAAQRMGDNDQQHRTKEDVVEEIRRLGPEDTLARLTRLCDVWKVDSNALTVEQQMLVAFQQFGLSPQATLVDVIESASHGLREIDKNIEMAELDAMTMYHRLRELELLPERRWEQPTMAGPGNKRKHDEMVAAQTEQNDPTTPEQRDNLRRILAVLKMVFYAKRVVLSAFQLKLSVHEYCLDDDICLDGDLETRLGSWALRFRYINNKTTPWQNLLLFLLDAAMEQNLRKSGGWMYRPILVGRTNTHAWHPVCEIKDFVHRQLQKETNWEQWCNATNGGMKNISSAIEYLGSCRDYQLPELHKRRGVYSFKNGVYFAHTDTFHRFGVEPPLSSDVVACKFFDCDLDDYAGLEWDEIDTPHLQSIMDYQQYEPEVCMWLYVMLGRLLYSLNEMDRWQVIPFLKGQASSGKSTIILHVCKLFFDVQDVGNLSNNIESKFGLSAFYDKMVFLAPEVRSTLCMDQAEFQSMVSGEDLQVNVKNKTAFAVTWRVPGALAGNEVPSWADNSGSVQRRVVVFEFGHSVVNGDMKLGEKLQREISAIIVKCNKAYLKMVQKYSDVNLWAPGVLPEYFRKTRDELAQSVNSLEAFLAGTNVRYGADLFCPMTDFAAALTTYERSNNFKSTKHTKDLFRGPFAKYNLSVERKKLAYRGGRVQLRDYVVGVDLVSGAEDAEDDLA